MNDEEQFRQLVDRWEELHQQGRDPSVEELCSDQPQLADRLRKWVRMLQATDWLCQPLVSGDGPTVGFNGETRERAELGPVSVDDFLKNLADARLLPLAETDALRSTAANDGNALAAQLVEQGKLTQYQADCVCRGKTTHLVLGDYLILDVLGSGGMGRVFRAVHRRLNRLVALKVLPPSAVDREESVQRFQREIQAVAKLSHPNIVAAHDAGCCNDTYFFVMDLIDGQDLAQRVKEKGPLPPSEAVECILQVARGLEYAHAAGVIHRDIKPSNLLLDEAGSVRILDLGVARFTSRDEGLTNTGCILGTVDYMAPEQAINTKLADHRADIYSLGCTLYYLLTGQSVYGGETAMERLLAHREHPIPSLKSACPAVSDGLDTVFQRMLAKKPAARWQTMGQVIAALQRPPCKRRLWPRVAAVVMLAACVVAAVMFSQRRDSSKVDEPIPNQVAEAAPSQIAESVPDQVMEPVHESVPVPEVAPSPEELKAIEWVFSMGGRIELLCQGKRRAVVSMAALPPSPFRVVKVQLEHNGKLADDDLANLAPLTTTEELWFGDDRITGVGCRHLLPITRLRSVLLWGTPVTAEGVEQIAKLDQLTELDIGNNRNITDAALEPIKEMTNLRALHLPLTSISDKGLILLRGLTNLTNLVIRQNEITDAGLEQLTQLNALETLDVRDTNVTAEGIQRLKQHLPKCQILRGNMMKRPRVLKRIPTP